MLWTIDEHFVLAGQASDQRMTDVDQSWLRRWLRRLWHILLKLLGPSQRRSDESVTRSPGSMEPRRKTLLLNRLTKVKARISKETGALTRPLEQELLELGVSPDALGAARRSEDWNEALKAGIERDWRILDPETVLQPVGPTDRSFTDKETADVEEVRALGEQLRQYEALLSSGPCADAVRTIAFGRVGEEYLIRRLASAELLVPPERPSVLIGGAKWPENWDRPVNASDRVRYLLRLRVEITKASWLHVLLPLRKQPSRRWSQLFCRDRLPGVAELLQAAKNRAAGPEENAPWRNVRDTAEAKRLAEWIEKNQSRLGEQQLRALADNWTRFEVFNKSEGVKSALRARAQGGSILQSELECLARIASESNEADLVRVLGTACLNEATKLLKRGGTPVPRVATTWLSPTGSAWLPQVCLACARSHASAAWIDSLKIVVERVEDESWLGLVHDDCGTPTLAVALPPDSRVVWNWENKKDEGWQWREPQKMVSPQPEGVYLRARLTGALTLRSNMYQCQNSHERSQKGFPASQMQPGDWQLRRSELTKSLAWKRVNGNEYWLALLANLGGRQRWPEEDVIDLAQLVRPDLGLALREFGRQFPGKIGSADFRVALWQALRGAPDGLKEQYETLTRPPAAPRVTEAQCLAQVRAVGLLSKVLSQPGH